MLTHCMTGKCSNKHVFKRRLKDGCRMPSCTDWMPECPQEQAASDATFGWGLGHHLAERHVCSSEAFQAKTSFQSLLKLFIFSIKQHIFRIKVSHRKKNWKQLLCVYLEVIQHRMQNECESVLLFYPKHRLGHPEHYSFRHMIIIFSGSRYP